MKKLGLLAGFLALGAVLLWIVLRRDRHPDASSVAAFTPYMEIRDDFAPSWSPDNKEIIFCSGREEDWQLFIAPADGGAPRPFLSGPGAACLPAWSPDGARIAFSSNRKGNFQLMRLLGLAHPINIWTASASSDDLHQVTNWNATSLDPSWSVDGKQVAFSAFPGPRVMTVSASGGEAKFIADGLSPAWSPDGERVAYFSAESGRPGAPITIFVQPVPGGTAKHLNSFVVTAEYLFRPSLDWSPDGKRLLTTQFENGQWQPTVINITEDRVEQTLPVTGTAISPRWSHDGKRIAYGLTGTGHPTAIEVLTLESQQRTRLNQGPSASPAYTSAQLVRYRSAGGLEIPSWLYRQRDSDQPKHPGLIWLHGGEPGFASIGNQFDRNIQYFVDQGLVVLAPNYRGSAGFGAELAKFDRGDDVLPDIVAGVDYLRGLNSVDGARIGVVGFSFGGYLVLRCITQRPELFATAVDFYGFSDLVKYYQAEPTMQQTMIRLLGGTPERQPEAYRAASPVNFVDKIKTPLLILHGTGDESVPFSQSVELAAALKRAHKNYEFLSYRFAGHGFSGADNIDANQQALRFLLAHLNASRL